MKLNKYLLTVILFIMYFSVLSIVLAVTIVYKDSSTIEGDLEDMNNKYVVVSNALGKIQIPVDNVKAIIFRNHNMFQTGREVSIGGKKYEGYATELSKEYVTVTTWFGNVRVNLKSDILDFIGFE